MATTSMKMASNLSTVRQKTNQNIQVYLRVRPTNERERLIRSIEMVEVPSPREVLVKQTFDNKSSKKFTFDRAFGPESKQAEVYQSVVAPLIEEVLSGYNCTVFAYGQTGTGKTHTMVGDDIPSLISSWEDDSDLGIIPRALSHLFQELRLMAVEFSMRVSYLELYNEELCDLLSSSEATSIRIFDDANKKGSIIVQGLEEIPVHSTADVYKLLAKGQEKRKTASTLMNAQSSRSHTIFSILVHIRENGIDGEELLKIGKLNLVDLAGSENITKAGNEKGIRTRETVNINQSLLTLGRVITALVERTPHIPYRESKLTRLLQESLGGRTKTSIIATVSPGHKDLEETLSTLEYAHRAKHIQNKPEINQKLTKKTVLKEYTEEIDRLKRDLMASRDKNGIYLAEETYSEMIFRIDSQNKDLNDKQSLIKALKDEMSSKQKIFNEISLNLVDRTEQLKTTNMHLATTRDELGQTKNHLGKTQKRYQEKKHLLETHVTTEKQLTDQATALIQVADSASTDTYRLHDTIDRRRAIDVAIESACGLHAQTMDEQLAVFYAQLDEFSSKYSAQSLVQLEEFTKNGNEHDEFSSAVLLKMKDLVESTNNSCAEMRVRAQIHGNELSTFSADIQTTNVDQLNGIHVRTKEFCIESQHELNKFGNDLTKQKETLQANKTTLESTSATTAQQVNAFCSSQLSDYSAVSIDLVEYVRANNEIIAAQKIRNAKTKQSLQEICAAVQKVADDTCRIDEDIEAVSANLKSIESRITSAHEQNEKNVNAFKQKSDSDHIVTNEILANLTTDLKQYHEVNQAMLQQITTSTSNCDADITARVEDARRCIDAQHTEMTIKIAVLLRDIHELEVAGTSAITTDSTVIVDSIQTESNRLRSNENVFTSLQSVMASTVGEYGDIIRDQVARCQRSNDQFHRKELKTYNSTGETPSRKQFTYPKMLVSTSPHDRIVRRFWNNFEGSDLDCSTAISEDNESTFMEGITDEKSSSILQSITPLVDTERMQPNRPNVDVKTSSTTIVKNPLVQTDKMLQNRQNKSASELNAIVKPPLQVSQIAAFSLDVTPEFTGYRSNMPEMDNKENVGKY